MQSEEENNTQLDEYHRLLFQNQRRIYTYILSLVGNYSDADDLMQETISTMWLKFSDFRPGSDFISWGIKIAHYKILDYRRKKQKQGLIQLYSDGIFDSLPKMATEVRHQVEDRIENMVNCLNKLNKNYLTVLKLRYFEEIDAGEIAKRVGLSVANVYKIMSRAHGLLLECIKRTS